MTRGRLPQATIEGHSPMPGKRWVVRLESSAPIGYLKITEVSGSTPQELRAFAAQLESEGLKALVLDLRGASQAHLHETVLLADALLDGGVIGRVRSVDGEKTYSAQPDALFRDWPMVVLAAGNNDPDVAWLCAALEDNHRATILGSPTIRGDATVSEMISLPGTDWAIELVTGRLERGDGRPIGVRPRQVYLDGGLGRVELAPDRPDAVKRLAERLQNFVPKSAPNANATPAQADDLARATEILEAALKAIAK